MHEDVFVYLDLTKEFLKKKEIIKAIKYYISEKNKVNINGHYGLLIFQEEGNPIFLTDKKDSDIIIKAIDENWKLRPRSKSFFENGLFYIFSYIAEMVRKKSKSYRVIVITDTPSDLSKDYTEALFNLVSKIKVFPTFIDILRISDKEKRFFKDDVKLNILASDTKGGIYYVQNKMEFKQIIRKLAQSKPLMSKSQKIKINRSDYEFYSHLAKDLKNTPDDASAMKCFFCLELICPVCMNVDDSPKICPECSSAFHKCCLINYIIQNNIGIPHIFRCPKCDILLKINQDEIVRPMDESVPSAEKYLEMGLENIEDEPKEHFNAIPQVKALKIKNQDQSKRKTSYTASELPNSKEKPRVVRIGGYFGKRYTVQKLGDKLIYQKVEPPHENSEVVFVSCPECSTQFSSDLRKGDLCPFCGYKLD